MKGEKVRELTELLQSIGASEVVGNKRIMEVAVKELNEE